MEHLFNTAGVKPVKFNWLLLLLLMLLLVQTQLFASVAAAGDTCEMPDQAMDRATLTLQFDTPPANTLTLNHQLDVCWKCPLILLATIPASAFNCSVRVDSRFVNLLELRHGTNGSIIWHNQLEFGQYGEYLLNFVNDTDMSPRLTVISPPNNANAPAIFAFSVIGAVFAAWIMLQIIRSFVKRRQRLNTDLSSSTEPLLTDSSSGLLVNRTVSEPAGAANPEMTVKRPKQRLTSLDAFRGLSLMFMIFVNYGGGGYWYFDHSFWNGLTIADLMFPWFTWIMGTSIALSFRGQLAKGASRVSLLRKVFIRTIILFTLGLMTQGGTNVDVSTLRIPGVLQRLALTYLVTSTLEIVCVRTDDYLQNSKFSPIRDIIYMLPAAVIVSVILALHVMLTFLLSDDGCPQGYLGPGGLHDNASYWNCTGGAAGYIDRAVLGSSHLYQYPTCFEVYDTTVAYDPEGILGTLTAVGLCFFGLMAGKILLLYHTSKQRVFRLLAWGCFTGLAAAILCGFSTNNGLIPVNKNLWSLSFICLLASFAYFLLTVLYLSIDTFQLWNGMPFIFLGMNSIVVYISHVMFGGSFPVTWQVPATHESLLPLHVWGVAFWTILAGILYRKKIFVAI